VDAGVVTELQARGADEERGRPAPGEDPPPSKAARRRRWRRLIGSAASLLVAVALLVFALPRIVSYRGIATTVEGLSWAGIALIAATAAINLLANWYLITAALPGISLRRAGSANLASTAVANTVPGGGAVAMGVSWAMFSSWGVSGEQFTLYALVTGVWTLLAKVATPVLAVLILAGSGRVDPGFWVAALIGLLLFVLGVVALAFMLHNDRVAAWLGRFAQRVVDFVFRILRRRGPERVAQAVVGFRLRAGELVRTRGRRLTLSTIASDLAWWVVLLACLRACGVGEAQVSWERSFAAFALTRLISSVPITPGGVGVIELGLTGYLTAGVSGVTVDRVGAAVLLTRVATYLLPIPLGLVAYLSWRFRGKVRPVLDEGGGSVDDSGGGISSGDGTGEGEGEGDIRADSGADSTDDGDE
jgi:putative heme transporter